MSKNSNFIFCFSALINLCDFQESTPNNIELILFFLFSENHLWIFLISSSNDPHLNLGFAKVASLIKVLHCTGSKALQVESGCLL